MRRAAGPILAAALAVPAVAAEIDERLAAIAAAAGGTLGVSALNVKTGERVRLNADQRFPMASTFKLPVAIEVLRRVERGGLRLDERLPMDPGNLSPGSGELDGDTEEGSSVADLLKAMMRNSNNTASDVLMARVGGPAAINGRVKAMGIDGLEVNRSAAELQADAWGFTLPPPGSRTRQNLQAAVRSVRPAKRDAAIRAFLQDPRDTTTPDAMVAVLERLQSGKALEKRTTELLIDHMERCRTGTRRIRGELPRGTTVAHKTGTLLRIATSDVGMVGPMVIAIYVKGSKLPLEAQERAIAQAALAAYRHLTR